MMPIEPLKYITLNDFTPGIWAGNQSGALGVASIPAPLGAAQEEDTYGCIANRDGGLVPLPSATFSNLPAPEATPASGGFVVNGVRALPTGLHYGLTWLENATNNEKFRWYRDGSSAIQVVTHTGNATLLANWVPRAFTTAVTRLTSAAVNNISIVGAWQDLLGGGGRLWYFPDPAAPGVDAPAADVAHTGQLFAHQGRVLCFTPATVAHGATGVNTTTNNELIQYTDPAQSATMGTQNTLLSPESPFGYGCWGSISAGELLLIKFGMGGLMMYEDIVYPRVVRLPGIAGTNGYMQEGSFCSAGLVYLSKDSGAYVWNGNNTAQKISEQISPWSLAPLETVAGYTKGHPVGFGTNKLIKHTVWLDRVVFPNNWMWDPALGSWWKIASNVIKYSWWASYGTKLYGLPLFYSSGTNQLITYDTSLAVQFFSWKSQPIVAATPSKTFSIREVEVIAHAAGGGVGAQVVVTLTSPEGTSGAITFPLNSSSTVPEKIVKQLDTPLVCSDVTVKIESTAASSPFAAPTIHAVNIGFGEDRSISTPFS